MKMLHMTKTQDSTCLLTLRVKHPTVLVLLRLPSFIPREDLRTALKGFDITDKAITEAVKEVNATGDAFVGPLVRSDNCCDRDSRASRPGVFE